MCNMIYAKGCGIDNADIFYCDGEFYAKGINRSKRSLIEEIQFENKKDAQERINKINELENGTGIEFDSDTFNWKDSSWAIVRFCPEKITLRPSI